MHLDKLPPETIPNPQPILCEEWIEITAQQGNYPLQMRTSWNKSIAIWIVKDILKGNFKNHFISTVNHFYMSLKKYLQQFDKEQLIAQIMELQRKYKDVKTYYEFTLNPFSDTHLIRVKKTIQNCFNTVTMANPKLRDARNAINGYKKLSPSDESLADIMLYFVECGVAYTNFFGDINEPFYNSIASMFYDACQIISNHSLKEQFKIRCKKILNDSDCIGWGFNDEISKYYHSLIEG